MFLSLQYSLIIKTCQMNILQSKVSLHALLKKGIVCAFMLPALLLGGCQKNATQPQMADSKLTVSESQTAQISAAAAAPTSGWTQASYTYSIQTPWNLPQSDRYSLS